VEKMKIKRKLSAIGIVVLFFAISLIHVEASEISQTPVNKPFLIEFGSINSDERLTTKQLYITEEELIELENAVALFMKKIESTGDFDWSFLRDLLEKIFGDNNSLIGSIFGIYSSLKISRNRGFVISSGHGIDFGNLKKISIKIRKKIGFWYYNSKGFIDDRTIIVKPLALSLKILTGRQFGIMTGFFGIYLSVSRGFLSNKYTFFMGTAKHIIGFDYSPDGKKII
jgi:hypothetical protein